MYVCIHYTQYVLLIHTYTHRTAFRGENMAKSRVNLTIDPYTHEKAKDVYNNFSQRVEELIEADLDVSKVQDTDLLKEEIKKKQTELEELNRKLEKLESRKDQVKADLNTAKATLKRKEREEREKSDEMERFNEVFVKADWKRPDEIPDYWSDELDMSKDKLWKEVEGEA